MAKRLVEILAEKLHDWPGEAIKISQRSSGRIVLHCPEYAVNTDFVVEAAEDSHCTFVYKEQWFNERVRFLLSQQPERCESMSAVVPQTFTQEDLKAAFHAGANWVNGAVSDGANEYVKGLK